MAFTDARADLKQPIRKPILYPAKYSLYRILLPPGRRYE